MSEASISYTPLRIDSSVEANARAGRWKALGRALQKYSPFMLYHDPPRGRKSVEEQLAGRTMFPLEAWSAIAPINEVQAILSIIQSELRWPNCHFVPNDPVELVMAGYDLDPAYALLAIKKRFGVEYSDADCQRILQQAWTLRDFVRDVLGRAASTSA